MPPRIRTDALPLASVNCSLVEISVPSVRWDRKRHPMSGQAGEGIIDRVAVAVTNEVPSFGTLIGFTVRLNGEQSWVSSSLNCKLFRYPLPDTRMLRAFQPRQKPKFPGCRSNTKG